MEVMEPEDMVISAAPGCVVLKALERKETTKGGIVLPASANDDGASLVCIVIDAGWLSDDDDQGFPLGTLAPGSACVISRHAGARVTIGNQSLVIVRAAEILAFLK